MLVNQFEHSYSDAVADVYPAAVAPESSRREARSKTRAEGVRSESYLRPDLAWAPARWFRTTRADCNHAQLVFCCEGYDGCDGCEGCEGCEGCDVTVT